MVQEGLRTESIRPAQQAVEPPTYWSGIKGFTKRNLAYTGSILAATVVAGGIGLAIRPHYIPEGTRVVVSANKEFEISYACVPNKYEKSDGTKHIEVTVTSSTYRTPDDPNQVLIIEWDEDYLDRFQQSDPSAAASPTRLPPGVFRGEASGSFERARGYIDVDRYPLNSEAEVKVTTGRVNPDTKGIEEEDSLTGSVPRYCN